MAENNGSAEQKYLGIQGARAKFSREMELAISSGKIDEAKKLKDLLEGQLKELLEEVDPFQYRLRRDFAKEYGYKYVGVFNEGYARAQLNDGTWVIVDKDDNDLQWEEKYAEAFPIKEGVARVKKISDGYYKFISLQGNQLPLIYLFARDFSEGYAAVLVEPSGRLPQYRFRDEEGDYIEDPTTNLILGLQQAKSFSSGLAPVIHLSDTKWVYINESGITQTDKNGGYKCFSDANQFSEGLAAVKQFKSQADQEKWIFVNTELEDVKIGQFDQAFSFSEGFAPVRVGNQGWYIDKSGKKLFGEQIFEFVTPFSDGIALLKEHDSWYKFMDKNGKTVFQLDQSETAQTFNEGVAQISRTGRNTDGNATVSWYYIDKKGNRIF